MTEGTGSPFFASLMLPTTEGIASYDLRCEADGVWSSYQLIQPGVTDVFGRDVEGVDITALDANGNGVITSGLLFEASFDSTGTFTGTLTETSVPEPSGFVLCAVGALGLSLWRRSRRPRRGRARC